MQTRKLLLATDFSPASARAREIALQLAKAYDAELNVLHVIEPPPYPYAVPLPESVRANAKIELERVTDELRRLGARAAPMLREGSPSSEIVAVAKETSSDLAILGTHGHRGLDHWLLGSVADKVVRLASAPVLTVPSWRYADRRAAGLALARALDAERAERPLVIALSRGALPIASEVVKAFATSLDVLLVQQVDCDGQAVGAVAEDGSSMIDEPAVAKLSTSRAALDGIIETARKSCRDESIALRGARWLIDIGGRNVVIVSDGASSPWPIAVASAILRKMGPRRVVAAAPALSRTAVEKMAGHVDEVVCIERVEDAAAIAQLYRDRGEPNDTEALALLSAAVTPAST